MSDYEIKSEYVRREGQPAPYYEPTRIPVVPRKKDCVGELCPFSETQNCWPTRHHLFFEHEMYMSLGYPYDELVQDPHASVMMSRCRHNSSLSNSWHKLYRYTELPAPEVAERFVLESQILQNLSVLVGNMSMQIHSIFDDRPRSQWRVFGEGKYHRKLEVFEMQVEAYGLAVREVSEIEVMPSSIVGGLVTHLGERRNKLQEQVAFVPDLAKIVLASLPKAV